MDSHQEKSEQQEEREGRREGEVRGRVRKFSRFILDLPVYLSRALPAFKSRLESKVGATKVQGFTEKRHRENAGEC